MLSKKSLAVITAVFFLLSILGLPVPAARAAGVDTDTQNTVQALYTGEADSFEDLANLLEAGADLVSLSAAVTVPQKEDLYVSGAVIQTGEHGIRVEGHLDLEEGAVIKGESGSQPMITVPPGGVLTVSGAAIETGDSGLRVEGSLRLDEGAAVTGKGVSQPVVELAAGGSLLAYAYSFEQAPCITATGDGGCALALLADIEEYYVASDSFLRVVAGGAGAAAIKSQADCRLYRTFIEAPAGAGVVCTGDVFLYLCQINAGTAAVDAPGFTADTCALSPAGDKNGTFIHRKIAEIKANRLFVALGEPVPDYVGGTKRADATLRAEGQTDVREIFWATTEIPLIDTGKPGLYPLPLTFESWLEPFDLLPAADLFFLDVYDPTVPYFVDIVPAGSGNWVDFYFSGDLRLWTLWRSDDEGENWYDYTEEAAKDWYWTEGHIVSLMFDDDMAHSVLLAWEAQGIGESEVLRITWNDGKTSGGEGGDRGGGGRGETVLPPVKPGDDPVTSPPPSDPGSDDQEDTYTPPSDSGDDGQEDTYTPPAGSGDGSQAPPGQTPPLTDSAGSVPGTPLPASVPAPALASPSEAGGETPPPSPAADVRPRLTRAADASVSSDPAPAPEAAKPTEAAGEDGVTVSGARLAGLIAANPAAVPFFHGELRVLLPSAWLQGHDLGETDSFTVALLQPDANSVSISFAINGDPLTASLDESFLLSLPWSGGPVSCVSADGEILDAVPVRGRVEFALSAPGSYTLKEQAASGSIASTGAAGGEAGDGGEAAPPSPESVSLPPAPSRRQPGSGGWVSTLLLGAGAVCAGAAVTTFLRKRLVKRP